MFEPRVPGYQQGGDSEEEESADGDQHLALCAHSRHTHSHRMVRNYFLNQFYFSSIRYGTFGYNVRLGKCDYLSESEARDDWSEEDDKIHPRVLFLSVGFILPMIMIVVSYFTIWRTSIMSSSFLKLNS